jgi:Bacterial dnaA protein helix-turn-helix
MSAVLTVPEASALAVPPRSAPSIRMIAEASATWFGVRYSEMISSRRHSRLVAARFVAMHVARTHTSASLPQIGLALGGRAHTTVMHALTRMDAALAAGHNDMARAIHDVTFAVGCGLRALETTGRDAFVDVDPFAAARRMLDQDAVRVSVEEVRAMAALIVGSILPLVEHEEVPPPLPQSSWVPQRQVQPEPVRPPLPAGLATAARRALDAYREHQTMMWTYGEKSAAARLATSMTALETETREIER